MSRTKFDRDFDHDFDAEDQHLVAFLRQNKPIAPEPSPNLEQRIMAEIQAQVMPQVKRQTSRQASRQPRRKLWFKGFLVGASAIAAGFIAVWSFNRQFQPTISEADRVQIEASLIKNWSASVGEDYASEGLDETSISNPIAEPHDTYE